MADLYYAQMMPGLQAVAWSEIHRRLDGASFEGAKELRGRNGLTLFRYEGPAQDLFRVRTIEDLFWVVERLPKTPWGREGLSAIYEALLRNRQVDEGIALRREIAGRRRGAGPITFRVIARMVGGDQPYRRLDFEETVAHALANRRGSRLKAVREGEEIEIWANLIGFDFVCGLRLSDEAMRHRDYKVAHVEGSLRPSVAAALAWLTEPSADDLFLDPLCGAGTVVIERALLARYRLLLGGDADPKMLQAAAANIGPRHKPRQLFRWDAGRLPLRAASIDRVATNLPFGKKVGTPSSIRPLYRAFCIEMDRVLAPRGRLVVLTSQTNLLREALAPIDGLRVAKSYPVTILGEEAMIYRLERPG